MAAFSRFLEAIHARPRWGWAGLLAYAAAVTFPHENVQWLVNRFAERITLAHWYRVSAAIAIVEALVLSGLVVWRCRVPAARGTLAGFWLLTLGLIGIAWRLFTANNTELVHYPQYLPEGAILMALTLSPGESLAWIAIFGGLDEAYQYAVLSWWRPVPFDFNDVFMDLLGGALGVLLAMAFLHRGRRDAAIPETPLLRRPGILALLSVLAVGILLWGSGLMLLFEDKADHRHWFALSRFRAPAFWFQVVANGPNRYHTLSPVEGPLLILATIGLYCWIDRRVKITAGG